MVVELKIWASCVHDLIGVREGVGDGMGVVDDVNLGYGIAWVGSIGEVKDWAPRYAWKQVEVFKVTFHLIVWWGIGRVVHPDDVVAGIVGAGTDAQVASAIGDEFLDLRLAGLAHFSPIGGIIAPWPNKNVEIGEVSGLDICSSNGGDFAAHPFNKAWKGVVNGFKGAVTIIVGHTEIQSLAKGGQVHEVCVQHWNPDYSDYDDQD